MGRRRMICSVCSKSQSNLSPMEAAALNSSGNSAAANAELSQQLKDKDQQIGKLQDELTKTHEALSKKRAEAKKKQELQDETCTAEKVGDGGQAISDAIKDIFNEALADINDLQKVIDDMDLGRIVKPIALKTPDD